MCINENIYFLDCKTIRDGMYLICLIKNVSSEFEKI